MSIVVKRLDRLRCHLVWTMEVGHDPGDFVLDGDPASPKKGKPPPSFRPMSIVANGWMDENATWYQSTPWPKPHCVRRGPSSPPQKGHSSPPLFSAHVYCGHGRPSHLLLNSCLLISSCRAHYNVCYSTCKSEITKYVSFSAVDVFLKKWKDSHK